MGYETSIDDRHAIVEIRLLGALPHSEHVRARDELLEICRVRDMRKILVDARELVGDGPSMTDIFTFGASWAALARRTPVLVAGVLPHDPTMRERLRFGEIVTANRGFLTQAFGNIEQARTWLRNAKG